MDSKDCPEYDIKLPPVLDLVDTIMLVKPENHEEIIRERSLTPDPL